MKNDPNDTGPLIDISVPYAPHVPVWPGDTPYSCGWVSRREDQASVNLGAITTSLHAGTHADAPLHVESDWPASESLAVDAFVGRCTMIAIPDSWDIQHVVTRAYLEEQFAGRVPERLLMRTGRTVADGNFPDAWATLDTGAAEWLVANGLRLFGTDAPSVDSRHSTSLPVHHVLFSAGASLLENLSLGHVTPGEYTLFAQPIAVNGADAAPVRALLRAVEL